MYRNKKCDLSAFCNCELIQQICILEQKYNIDYDMTSTFKEHQYNREMKTCGHV